MRILILLLLSCASQVQAQMNHTAMLGGAISSTSTPSENMTGMVHDYQPVQVPSDVPLPQLALQLHRDAMEGINLHLTLQNFVLGPPENTTQAGVLNGHAHLYVNGQKVQRIYGQHTHLPNALFRPGVNLITVSLNNHSHAVWQQGKKQLVASSYVNLEKESLVIHSFSSSPL